MNTRSAGAPRGGMDGATRGGARGGTARGRRALLATIALLVGIALFASTAPNRAAGLTDAAPDPASTPATTPAPQSASSASADLEMLFMMGWAGYGTRVSLSPVVHNKGPGVSSGHSLVFAPEPGGTDREVTVPDGCEAEGTGYRCTGEPLQPGEMAVYDFVIAPPSGPDLWAPFWSMSVTGDDSDPDEGNNRSRVELPESTHVQVVADVKIRVEDANGDGKATPGESAEIYVYFANDSEYELHDVLVEISGLAELRSQEHPPLQPGEEITVKFEAVVPDDNYDVSATVHANAVEGGRFSALTGRLAVTGPFAAPNPEGLRGPQGETPEYNPREHVDVDLAKLEAYARYERENAAPAAPERQPGGVGPSATEAPNTKSGASESSPAGDDPSVGDRSRAVADPRQQTVTASAPAANRADAAPLVLAGMDPLRGPFIIAVGLIGFGVILAQIGFTWRTSRRR